RNATSVAVALGVHAGVLATLAAICPREIQPPLVAEVTEVAIEPIETEPSTTPFDSAAGAAAAVPSTSVAGAVAAAVHRTTGRRQSTKTAPGASAEPSPTPTPDATWSFWSAIPAPPMNLTLPLAGAANGVRSETSPSTPGPAPASTTGGLREGLAAHDHEL